MTGGVIPKPFDSIVPFEKVKYFPSKQKPTHIVVDYEVKRFSFIRFAGEDNNLKDFDLAYAYESMARAYSISGDEDKSEKWYKKAKTARDLIASDCDKEYFISDLNSN